MLKSSIPILLALLLVGCGGEKLVPASGKVTLDGKPLETGSIQVVPDQGRPAYGNIGAGGHFELMTDDKKGVLPGTHKVVVSAQEITGTEDTGEVARQITPLRYASLDKSDLTVTIDGPTEDLLIELSSTKTTSPSAPAP